MQFNKKLYKIGAKKIASGVPTSLRGSMKETQYQYACVSIGDISLKEREKFVDYFQPEIIQCYPAWYGEVNNENQLARTLGLLLMYEIAKEEGL